MLERKQGHELAFSRALNFAYTAQVISLESVYRQKLYIMMQTKTLSHCESCVTWQRGLKTHE